MNSVLQDLRYAIRRLRAAPAFTLAVVVTLALGIGGASATFSFLDGAVLRPLPFADPERLVRLREVTPQGEPFPISEPDYLDYAQRLRSVSSMAAIRPLQVTMTGAGPAVRLDAAAVTASLFPLLGIRPVYGRVLSPDDDRDEDVSAVAILSHRAWRQRFGGDSTAVGKVVLLDGRATTIVGVLADTANFPPADVWLPLRSSPRADRGGKWLDVVARLAPGASVRSGGDEAGAITTALSREHPQLQGWSARMEPLQDWIVGPGLRRMAWVLIGAVATLLGLACANIAGLLMARGAGRRAEIGVRTALGAERVRLVRQLLTENLMLGVVGGAAGLLMAVWTLDAMSAVLRDVLPPGREAQLDGRTMAATIAIMLVATVAFGLFPAMHASRGDVRAALRSGERGATTGNARWTGLLVAVQVMLAMVLIVGSFLLGGSLARLSRVDVGFDAVDVLTVPLSLPDRRYGEEARPAFFERAFVRLAGLPGVESVAATATNPFRQWGYANDVTPEEQASTAPASGLLQAGWRAVTPGFFATLRVPVVSGRAFTAADRDGAPRVAVVSRSLATRLWPGQDAVGRRLYWGGVTGRTRTVVGVVGDIRDVRLDAPMTPMLYLPYGQLPLEDMTVLIRMRPGVPRADEAVRRELQALDAALPIAEIRPLVENRGVVMSAARLRAAMLSVFGAVALLLASVGLYGVVAFTVSQRTREIAIRVALGARPAQVTSFFFRRGATLAAMGVGAGLFVAWAGAGVLDALLFQTRARDPRLFGLAAALLAAVTLLASYLPARRAARLDPISGLGRE